MTSGAAPASINQSRIFKDSPILHFDRMRLQRISHVLLVIIIAASVLAVAAVAFLGQPGSPGPRYEVSVSTDGVPVVGMDFRISVTVRDRLLYPGATVDDMLFLSLVDVVGTFEILSQEVPDDPWGLPGTWNLSGVDLSAGRVFPINTTPTWGAEQVLWAYAWSPRGGLSTVEFLSPGKVALGSVYVKGSASLSLTIGWPIQLDVSATGNLSVRGNVSFLTWAQGIVSGPRTPPLLFLSLELSPYYRVLSRNLDDDPWGMPNIWNVSGIDLSLGIGFSLDASPTTCGSRIPLEARVWSPRGSWASVQYNATYDLQTPDALFLWGSRTVDFPVC